MDQKQRLDYLDRKNSKKIPENTGTLRSRTTMQKKEESFVLS